MRGFLTFLSCIWWFYRGLVSDMVDNGTGMGGYQAVACHWKGQMALGSAEVGPGGQRMAESPQKEI